LDDVFDSCLSNHVLYIEQSRTHSNYQCNLLNQNSQDMGRNKAAWLQISLAHHTHIINLAKTVPCISLMISPEMRWSSSERHLSLTFGDLNKAFASSE